MALTYKTQGIIIKSRAFKGADRLYTIYTQDHGKVVAIARGVKKSTSKLAGHLEPLTLSNLFIAASKGIDKLAGSQTLNSYQQLKQDLEKLNHLAYLLEVLDKATPEGLADQRVFELLKETLDWYTDNTLHALIKPAFILKFMEYQGFRPELNEPTDLNKVLKFLLANPYPEIVKLRIADALWLQINDYLKKYLEYQLEDNLQSERFLV